MSTVPVPLEAAVLHRTFTAVPAPRRTTRAVHQATRPPANPPLDGAAMRRSVAALERVVGH
jgi:hypothetical protein